MKPPVALLGLGLMGRPMAANLLKAGHELTVWNRTAARGDSLVAGGAKRAATPREAAAAAEVVLTIVSDPPALESVLWGESGVFAGLRKGSVLIESSTVSPALEKRAAEAAAAQGSEFLEESYQQHGSARTFRWEIPYFCIVELAERPEIPSPSASIKESREASGESTRQSGSLELKNRLA